MSKVQARYYISPGARAPVGLKPASPGLDFKPVPLIPNEHKHVAEHLLKSQVSLCRLKAVLIKKMFFHFPDII